MPNVKLEVHELPFKLTFSGHSSPFVAITSVPDKNQIMELNLDCFARIQIKEKV